MPQLRCCSRSAVRNIYLISITFPLAVLDPHPFPQQTPSALSSKQTQEVGPRDTPSPCLHAPHTHTTVPAAQTCACLGASASHVPSGSLSFLPSPPARLSSRSPLPGGLKLSCLRTEPPPPQPLHLPARLPVVNGVTPPAHSFPRARGVVCSSPAVSWAPRTVRTPGSSRLHLSGPGPPLAGLPHWAVRFWSGVSPFPYRHNEASMRWREMSAHCPQRIGSI